LLKRCGIIIAVATIGALALAQGAMADPVNAKDGLVFPASCDNGQSYQVAVNGNGGPCSFRSAPLRSPTPDLFRGVPTILLIFMLGFGAPALAISGVPRSPFVWAVVALVLVYSAYVAEVYRAGIESVHPSQDAAARSLGLSRWQSLRFVVVPQAVRRVVPPLLNDFIGLQKDTALVALIGPVETFRQSQIDSAATFNFTPYVAAAVVFIIFTIPLARFTDWLAGRSRRRRLAAGGIAP
jgi:polar amino acid transport system permease protein